MASARVCGASIAAAQAIHDGSGYNTRSILLGLAHSMPANASGFCVLPATTWRSRLLAARPRRGAIGYVDVDVHHGDGVQEIFYNDPRVMTVSLHESRQDALFPGSGCHTEIGGPNAHGTTVNIPRCLLEPMTMGGCGHSMRSCPKGVAEVRAANCSSHSRGCDSHRDDPLAHLRLTLEGQRASHLRLHELAHRTVRRSVACYWWRGATTGWMWSPIAWAHLDGDCCGQPDSA